MKIGIVGSCEENKLLSANIVVCTNPLKPRLGGLAHHGGKSGAEKIADWLPNSKVIKLLNQTGAENMREPIDRPLMLFSTDHEDLTKDFMSLLESTGFDGRYAGLLNSSIYLEYLVITRIHLAIRTELGRNFSFHIAEEQK
ncbi:MAG: hypothetical protein HRU19_20125 [Pseudobacteriovorax sp.]|nr:hypothetical protein [Pseudobacteriovorax sp.]